MRSVTPLTAECFAPGETKILELVGIVGELTPAAMKSTLYFKRLNVARPFTVELYSLDNEQFEEILKRQLRDYLRLKLDDPDAELTEFNNKIEVGAVVDFQVVDEVLCISRTAIGQDLGREVA